MSQGPFLTRVETPEDRNRRLRYVPKSRSFSAQLVAFTMVGEDHWSSTSRDPLRPAFALFITTRQEEVPFLANLRKGRKLRVMGLGTGRNTEGWPLEFLKSAGYKTAVQRTPLGCAIEVFLTDLFEWKPGMVDPDKVSFLLSVKEARLREEHARFGALPLEALFREYPQRTTDDRWTPDGDKSVRYDPTTVLAEGRRFVSALDQRAEVPLPPDPVFGAQVLLSALRHGYAKRAGAGYYSPSSDRGFWEVNAAEARRAPGLSFSMTQAGLAAWLAAEVAVFDRARR